MATEPIRHDITCRLCGSDQISTVFHFTPTPPEDRFVSKEQLHVPQDVYPLDLALCEACGYVHLPYVLSPEISYPDYIYITKVTLGLRNHYQEYADEILAMIQPKNGSLVVDLGSNDGTMLDAFKKRGMKVLGVEPAKAISKAANDAGIPTIVEFFTDRVAEKIIRKHGKTSVVTANYMYANIDDLLTFTRNVAELLAEDGVFVVQTGYHPEQMKLKMFDYIYHEHFSYFTLKVLRYLFVRCGLELIDAQKTPAKGGSIRTVAQLAGGRRPVSERVAEIIREEEVAEMEKKETYFEYSKAIDSVKNEISDLLHKLKAEGKRMVGYGASHSTTTLTYHFGLAPFMEYLVDDNPIKNGLYSPGYHLPVFPSQKLYQDKPDYVIVLAWQYREPIIAKNKQFSEQGGTFIVPLPEVRVI
jgi:SAM-dependent methyltransferase